MDADFIEKTPTESYQDRLVYGPSVYCWDRKMPFMQFAHRFADVLSSPNCRDGFRIWCDILDQEKGLHRVDRSRTRLISSLAPSMHLVERLSGGILQRYRYIGQRIVEHYGSDLTGLLVHEFGQRTAARAYEVNRLIYEEARPGYIQLHYGQAGRPWIKVNALTVPARGPAGDDIQYIVGVYDFL